MMSVYRLSGEDGNWIDGCASVSEADKVFEYTPENDRTPSSAWIDTVASAVVDGNDGSTSGTNRLVRDSDMVIDWWCCFVLRD